MRQAIGHVLDVLMYTGILAAWFISFITVEPFIRSTLDRMIGTL